MKPVESENPVVKRCLSKCVAPCFFIACIRVSYTSGRVAEAEEAWEEACGRNEGCGRYKDLDYVSRIRRWPPAMVTKLEDFLKIK